MSMSVGGLSSASPTPSPAATVRTEAQETHENDHDADDKAGDGAETPANHEPRERGADL